MKTLILAALACGALTSTAYAADAIASVVDREGTELGDVRVSDTASGTALVTVSLTNLPSGIHAIHLHETGDCSADDFTSAGGHVAGDRQHGVRVEGGPHPGDMPNLTVGDGGAGEVEVFVTALNVQNDILDEDGAAFVMHDGADDYESQPAGDAGDRIACGEFASGS